MTAALNSRDSSGKPEAEMGVQAGRVAATAYKGGMEGFRGTWWRMWRTGCNTTRRFLFREPLRGLSMAAVLGTVGLLVCLLVRGVLAFLRQDERYALLADGLIDNILALFFFGLLFLVGLSTTLVTWSALFRTRSALYQAQLPLSNRALFWGASIEGGLWASWAMLVLGIPLIYGLQVESLQPWRYLGAGLIVLFGFLAVCMGVGAVGAICLARLIPFVQRGFRWLVALVVMVIALLAVELVRDSNIGENRYDYLNQVFARIAFIRTPYLPAAWAQEGLSSAMRGYWSPWIYNVSLLYLSAATLFILAETIAHKRLRLDLDLLSGRSTGRKPRSKAWQPANWLPKDIALLVAKDLRLFVRDPAQILQFLLFFGLLGFYIMLLPRIGKAFLDQQWWTQTVSLLNMLAVSMALATFTGRFVYPMLSLEGKRLWVLVLAPWSPRRVVTAKFVFALLVGVPISTGLVGLSSSLLDMEPRIVAYQCLATVCLGFGLAAGALGIGARLADYEEDNPAKLVAGYGGTVNLLASLVYTTLILAGAAIPILYPGDAVLGWTLGLGWTLMVTWVWTAAFLGMAWKAFARQAGQA